jgi:transcription elongation factor GreA
MLLEAAASSHPGWADGFLRELVFHGSDPDLLLWAASVLLAEGLESPEETRAVIRAALDSIPRGRADSQRRASRTIVEKAGDELRSFLAGLDARKLSNLSGLLDECGPAHETGLCLEIRRESSGRSADSGRAYYFWESDFVFDSPGAIRRRAEAIEKLRTVEIPAAAEAVGEAAAHGDLSENAEYKAALERRDLLLERLSRWSDEFGRLRPYPSGDISSSVSSPGTGVRLEGADGEITFHLTGPVEARPEDGRVNYLAPLGAALLGRRRGEEIELPGRDGVFTVRDIFPLPGEEEA